MSDFSFVSNFLLDMVTEKIVSTHWHKDYSVMAVFSTLSLALSRGNTVWMDGSDMPAFRPATLSMPSGSGVDQQCFRSSMSTSPISFPALESHQHPVGVERRHLNDSESFFQLASPRHKVLPSIKVHRSSRLSIFKCEDALILSELAPYGLLMTDWLTDGEELKNRLLSISIKG